MEKKNAAAVYALPVGTLLKGESSPLRVSPYRITRVLGQGGFGITYEARATIMVQNIPVETSFAVKELFLKDVCHRDDDLTTMCFGKGSADNVDSALRNFESEARRLVEICRTCRAEAERSHGTDTVSVNNHNVVPVNEFFRENETAYFVMEYLDGGSLRDMVRRDGPMDEQHALDLMMPIIEAVEYIHGMRIMHMDIKPENIVMRRGVGGRPDVPMLIDFGVSLHFTKRGDLTSRSNMGGYTKGFAPIEQAAAVEKFDERIDVYALGATLFYLLTGHAPVDAFDISQKYIEEQLPDDISDTVRQAIVHAMTKDKVDRTPSPAQLLRELLPAEPAGATDEEGENVTQVISRGPKSRKTPKKRKPAKPAKPSKPKEPAELGKKLSATGQQAGALATKLWKPLAALLVVAALIWAIVAYIIPMMHNDNSENVQNTEPADTTVVAPQTDEPLTDTTATIAPVEPEKPQQQDTEKPEPAKPSQNEKTTQKPEKINPNTGSTTTTTTTPTTSTKPDPTPAKPEPAKNTDTETLNLLHSLQAGGSAPSAAQMKRLNDLARNASPSVKAQVNAFNDKWDY